MLRSRLQQVRLQFPRGILLDRGRVVWYDNSCFNCLGRIDQRKKRWFTSRLLNTRGAREWNQGQQQDRNRQFHSEIPSIAQNAMSEIYHHKHSISTCFISQIIASITELELFSAQKSGKVNNIAT
jgi:hypothetical protein